MKTSPIFSVIIYLAPIARATVVVAAILLAVVSGTVPAATMDGLTPATAGISAKQILNYYPGSSSGVYWIDPDGPGGNAPFTAYGDMITSGGGWTLGLNSVAGNQSSGNEIIANSGVVSLVSAHTRDLTVLAVDRPAQIRHEIRDTSPSVQTFDAYYTAQYYDPMAISSLWTRLSAHTTDTLLNYHFGQHWTSPVVDNDTYAGGNCASLFGASWYHGSCWTTMPSTSSPSYPSAPYAGGSNNPVDRYSIWIREVNTPSFPTASIGGPYVGTIGQSLLLNASGSFDSDGSLLTYEWDINGDADVSSAGGLFEFSTGTDQLTIPWATLTSLLGPISPGSSYTLGLRVTDNEGFLGFQTALLQFPELQLAGVPEPSSLMLLGLGGLGLLARRRRQNHR